MCSTHCTSWKYFRGEKLGRKRMWQHWWTTVSGRVRLYSEMLMFSFIEVSFFLFPNWNDKNNNNYSLVQQILFLVRPSFGIGGIEVIMTWPSPPTSHSWSRNWKRKKERGYEYLMFMSVGWKNLFSFLGKKDLYFHLKFFKLNL